LKILIVGGTGFIGGDAATLLQSKGHEITVGGRKPAPPESQTVREGRLTVSVPQQGLVVVEIR